jgi:hypothetical protein
MNVYSSKIQFIFNKKTQLKIIYLQIKSNKLVNHEGSYRIALL